MATASASKFVILIHRRRTQFYGTKDTLLDNHRSVGADVALRGIRLRLGQSAGGRGIYACRISPATACHSWRRKNLRLDHAPCPRPNQTEGVGLRRIHLRLDIGIFRALSGE